MLMQNWSHVKTVVEHLNREPTKLHGTDIHRIRPWYYDKQACYYRQTIILSSHINPEINALFNQHCLNYRGKVKLECKYKGVLPKILVPVRQIYERFDVESIAEADDARLKYFCEKQFKLNMGREFEMSDLGDMKYFLGMEIDQNEIGIFISQRKYAWEVLKKFHMEKAKSVTTPLIANEKLSREDGELRADASIYRSLIGSLLYLSVTRPDIMFSASLLSRFMHSPSQVHLGAAKRVLRYIKGTVDFGLHYFKNESENLIGYSDSDWAGSVDDCKSTSGYCFSFGSGVFSWNSRKQEVVAQSSAEAEYISAAEAANQAIWLRKLLKDLGLNQEEATLMWVDSKSAIDISKNPVQHGRTKHINEKYHAIREAEKRKEINLMHCSSEFQLADIMTKALPKAKFEFLRSKLGVSKKNIKEEC